MTPFALPIKDLLNLGQDRSVEFIRRLLWAEAAKVGIAKFLVDVPDCINVSDGGIDAFIKDASHTANSFIPKGNSGYQIKSSDLGPTACKSELHEKGELNRPIKPEIKRLLDDGGIYILVLFAELTKKLRTKRKKALKEEFSRLGYSNEFRIYSANQLANFSESFPALVAWFRGYGSECLPYSSWSEYQEIIRPKKFIFDEDRKKWMEEIQQKLRNANDDYVIYRITGLSGIGKTRFVYETLSANDLKHRVIYVKAEHFRLSNIYTSLQNDPNISTILVIDECDLNQHDEFVRSFSGKGSRVCLFTLSYERGKVPPPSMSYHLEPLSVEKISEIVKTEKPDLPDNLVDRISKFADGYPRIATLLIDSYPLGDASSEEFWNISDDALMNRLIGGKQEIYLPDFKLTKKVLQRLSLFQKVGYYGNLEKEAKWIAEMIKVDYSNFKEIVEQQRRRGIIQGTYYIYVTPFVLRIHLFREWWLYQRFTKESFIEFITSIPEDFRSDLFERFLEHIPYIADVESGKEFIESILGEEGVFLDGSLLKNRLGASFFLKLTEADPKAALDCLNRTVARWTKEELINFTTGRREVIWALERMVMWKNLFNDAARLLLALGEAENETWSNNASGVFVQLFSPAYGRVAPTEASPQERFPILKEAMESKSKERRLIALRACDQALESQHFSRMIGAEFQGLRKEPKLWMPKTYGELFDSYRQVWEFLLSKLGMLPEDERDQGVEILLKRSRGIGRIANLTNMVIDTVYELIKKSYLDKKKALIQVSRILHYDAKEMIPELRQKWVKLKNDLTGVDYASLMRRYVGIILLEDHFDEEGKYKENLNQKYIQELANKSVENPQLIEAELKWLVTNEAQNGHKFGYELGLKDKNYTLLNSLIKAQENVEKYQSFNFLGGYFKAMNEKNPDEREKQFEIFAKDRKKSRWIAELTWRSGLNDNAALRILRLLEEGLVDIQELRIFGYGSVINNLSEIVFKKWIKFLIEKTDQLAVSIALILFGFYYVHRKSKINIPKQLTLKLLTHSSLYQDFDLKKYDQLVTHHWTEIGKQFIKSFPTESLRLADIIIEHFGEDNTIVGGHFSETQEVLFEILKLYPEEIWLKITKYIGPPIDIRAYNLKNWLRGGEFLNPKEGALTYIPPKEIFEWVDTDIENRAWYIATFVPNKLFRSEDKICLAREVLLRYGEREDVQQNLYANFDTEGWSGPASSHYYQKKISLSEFKKEEDNINVIRWIDKYISDLERGIERSKIKEERRGF